ncbi:MAG: alpha/beta hydrolase [Thermodesulfobacteriota bacterium]|nr:alpha/beta hydrolase [Thermodesulfobacteriota bacterium]
MPTVSITSGTIEYVAAGKGTPLILLHGGTGSIQEWGGCIDHFATKYRVIAYNRRGYGGSSPRYHFSEDFFREDVEDLAALLDALGIFAPVLLCAFSDGGTVALIFAATFPERTRAMVCAGAHIYVDEKASRGLLRAKRILENRLQHNGVKETAQVRSQRAWFDRWLHPNFKPFSIEDKMRRINCPTLVVQGMEDEYAEPSHAQRIAQGIKASQLWLVEGARHWVHGGGHKDLFQERAMAFLDGH